MQAEQVFERDSECEQYEDYGPEGYHPVIIGTQQIKQGERFNNQYIVQQKLGWGYFSTVWLVSSDKRGSYSALKIQKSKQSYSQSAVDQLQMLQRIRAHENDEQWVKFRSQMAMEHPKLVSQKLCQPLALLDNFVHHGIHGKHYCSVFELMGPNLLDLIQHYQFNNQRMPLWLVKKITIDVLMGLVHLHDFSRIIHTDLKPENIMMKLHPEEQAELIKKVKQYKVKPLSMKYLKNIQASKSTKNKKKYEKKKLKKQLQKEQSKKEGEQADKEKQSSKLQSDSTPNQDSKQQSLLESEKTQLAKKQEQQATNQTKDNVRNRQEIKRSKDKDKIQNEDTNKQNPQKKDMSILKWKNMDIKLNTDVFFKIADMGNACFIQKHFTQGIQTREYRSPEVLVGQEYGPNTDIWSLACTVFELMTNNFLFKPKRIQGISKDQDHFYKMIQVLGSPSKQFATTGTDSSKIFNKKGKLLHGNPKQQLSISILLTQDYDYDKEQAEKIQKFLLPMLEFEPAKRLSARKCLQSEWLWQ